MITFAWVVNWEDLSVVCLSKSAAVGYVENTAEEIEANIEWAENEEAYVPNIITFNCTWPNGTKQAYDIERIPFIK